MNAPLSSNPILAEVLAELERATVKFPTWPYDPLHAVAVVQEEVGELTKAVLQSVYEPQKSNPEDVHEEAIQAAAMALRFAMSLDRYEYKQCPHGYTKRAACWECVNEDATKAENEVDRLTARVAELEGELDKYGRSGWYQRVKELTAELKVERQRVTALQENLRQFVTPGQPVETEASHE